MKTSALWEFYCVSTCYRHTFTRSLFPDAFSVGSIVASGKTMRLKQASSEYSVKVSFTTTVYAIPNYVKFTDWERIEN